MPSTKEWRVELDPIPFALSDEKDNPEVYVTITLDREPLGTLLLPDMEHLRYLREKLQG